MVSAFVVRLAVAEEVSNIHNDRGSLDYVYNDRVGPRLFIKKTEPRLFVITEEARNIYNNRGSLGYL